MKNLITNVLFGAFIFSAIGFIGLVGISFAMWEWIADDFFWLIMRTYFFLGVITGLCMTITESETDVTKN